MLLRELGDGSRRSGVGGDGGGRRAPAAAREKQRITQTPPGAVFRGSVPEEIFGVDSVQAQATQYSRARQWVSCGSACGAPWAGAQLAAVTLGKRKNLLAGVLTPEPLTSAVSSPLLLSVRAVGCAVWGVQ